MKKIKIDYKFIVFLYTYLRQVDLSLDRSRWGPLEELRKFYKTQILPEKVARYIIKMYGVNEDKLKYPYFIGEAGFIDKFKDLFLRVFRRQPIMFESEIIYCCQKLIELEKYLESDQEPHKLEIEKLRIEIAKLNYDILQFKISSKDRERAMYIEHFLQHDGFEPLSIEHFMVGFKI